MFNPVENVGQIGIIKDVPPHTLPDNAWSDGRNVRFRDGYAENTQTIADAYGTPPVAPYFMMAHTATGSRSLIYAGLSKLYSVSGSTHTNITRQSTGVDIIYSATSDQFWTGFVLGGIAVLNNPADTPQFWNGSVASRAADLSNWTAGMRCKALRVFKNYLIALNVTKGSTNYQHMVKWSHPADPGSVPSTWDHTDVTKDAGEYDLSDSQSRIVDGLALGDQFIIYKESSIYSMTFIGQPFIFRFQKISDYAGALSQNCVAEFPGGHVVLGLGDVFVHAGQSPVSILDQKMRKWLFQNFDQTYYSRSFVSANYATNEVWICFPTQGNTQANMAVVWNWKTGATSARDLPSIAHAVSAQVDYSPSLSWDSDSSTWDSDSTSWDNTPLDLSSRRMVLAVPGSTALRIADTTGGTSSLAYLERDGLVMGDASLIKTIRAVRPRVEANTGEVIKVYVCGKNDPNAGSAWQGPYNFTVGTSLKVDCFASGRYLGVRFESSSGNAWKMTGYDI